MKRVKTNGKKETTLDDLARMVQEGFGETSNGIEDLKLDMGEVKGRLDKVEDRLRVVETKLDRALYTELTHLEARMRRVEQKVGIRK